MSLESTTETGEEEEVTEEASTETMLLETITTTDQKEEIEEPSATTTPTTATLLERGLSESNDEVISKGINGLANYL